MIEAVSGTVFSELLFIVGVGVFVTVAGIICLILLVAGIRQKGSKSNITMICPNCGYETKPDFIVCPKCGKKLDGSEIKGFPTALNKLNSTEKVQNSEETQNINNSENNERNDD